MLHFLILTVSCEVLDHVLITSVPEGPDSNRMHSVKASWHSPLTFSIRVFRHSFGLILQSSLKPQSVFSTLFADQESFMRAFDIICVTFVTKLLLTSDVSSTPTKYSTSNPHSLISGDTHDVARALRISDESDIQQERAPYPSFDSLLEYIPLTAAAKIARVKDLLSMSTLSKSRLDAFCNTLLMDDDPKWRSMAEMLSKDIKPESLRLFLSRHLSNEIETNSIIDPYTTLRLLVRIASQGIC